jgi:8-oxo-dGTP diphosphatase
MTEHEVVGAVLVHASRVLLCHRRPNRAWYPDVWDLPGGHIEPAEPRRTALERECREELGIDVLEAAVLDQVTDGEATLSVFLVSGWSGEPANHALAEQDAVQWFTAADLDGLELADDRYRPLLRDALVRHSAMDVTRLPPAVSS